MPDFIKFILKGMGVGGGNSELERRADNFKNIPRHEPVDKN